MKKVLLLLPVILLTFYSIAQNIGIGTTAPLAKLDVNGDIAFRSVDIDITTTYNFALDVNTIKRSSYKLKQQTAANFVIAGITAGADGRIISLHNRSGASMEMYNEDPLVSTAANRITTGTGTTFAVYNGGTVMLRYDAATQRWEIVGSHYNSLDYFGGGGGGGYWNLSGTDIYNSNTGNVGIGTTTPTHSRLEINGSVGATVALFGADAFGVGISSNHPEIGFNYLYNGGTKTIKAGYAANFGMNYTTGDVYIGNFNGNQSASDFGSITGYQAVMTITQNGNTGLGNTTPSYRLDVSGDQRVKGSALSSPGTFGYLTGGSNFRIENNADDFVLKMDGTKIQAEKYKTFTTGSNASPLLLNPYGGNVAVGSSTATLGRFMVDGAVGNTVAMFRSPSLGGRGVSIITDFPGVFFNSYYNAGHKAMNAGYAGYLNFDPTSGDVYLGVDPNQAASAGSAVNVTSTLLMNRFGDVAIGTGTPSSGYKLTVNGNIRTKEVVVETGWADYVFDDSYKLRNLDEVAAHIRQHKHLPGVPSAKEIATNGLKMGEMQAKMMEKIEELTLYVIELKKEIESLKAKQ